MVGPGQTSRRRVGTRERLVEAATSLLDAGGEPAVTLRAVAQAVGVSHNTPYRHFEDRAALLAGVAEHDLRSFSEALEAIGQSGAGPAERVQTALDIFIRYGENHPARYRLLFSEPAIAARGGRLEIAAMDAFGKLATLIQQAQAARLLPDLAPARMTGLIFATVHGLIDLRAGGRMRKEKGFSSVLDGTTLLLRLLSPAADR